MTPAPRRRFWLPAVWLAVCSTAVLATLHSLAILPLTFESIPIGTIQRFENAAYTAQYPVVYYLAHTELPYRLHEDGRATAFPPSAGYGVVTRFGGGRFSLNGDTLFFSATDNSDPRSNGRQYTLVRPTPIGRRPLKALWIVALVVTAAVVLVERRAVFAFLTHPPFAVAALALVAAVLANRLWFFTGYPIPAIHPDSGGYYAVSEQIGTGVWPNFGNRPPVYPLLLKAIFTLDNRVVAMAAVQTALSLLGALALVYGAYRWARWLALPAAGVLALFLFGFTTFEHDTAMLSESVYTSFLMLSFGALLTGLAARRRALVLAAASTCMALAVLTRPGGMFLAVTYLIVVAWLWWNRTPRRAILAFAAPFPVFMLLISAYNWRVVGAFAPSTWGEANLAVATFVYWQTDPAYPPDVNASIEKIQGIMRQRFAVTHIDPAPMDRSWNPDVLGPIFVQSFNGAALDVGQMIGGNYETAGRAWIRRIASDAIRKRPGVYVRFVWAMLYKYFTPAPDYDFRLYLLNRVWVFYVDRTFSAQRGNALMVRMAKELADGPPPTRVLLTSVDKTVTMDLNERVVIPPTRLWRVYEVTHQLRQYLFEYWAWSWAVFIALCASAVALIRARGRDAAAFGVFIVTVSALGASLVVSLVEYSQPRYSYPMEWVYGMAVVLLPLLFVRQEHDRPAGGPVLKPGVTRALVSADAHTYTAIRWALHPVNLVLARLLKSRVIPGSVLHVSGMVHVPYITVGILREHGVRADYLAVGTSRWWSKADYSFRETLVPIVSVLKEWWWFWRVVSRYEVVHSHFMISVTRGAWEWALLKRMGRTLVVHYRGCEIRDRERNMQLHPAVNICEDCDYDPLPCQTPDNARRRRLAAQHGDAFLVTTPDMKDFVPEARHVRFFVPPDTMVARATDRPRAGRPFKIVHATNHPGIEGTARIHRAVESLKARGHAIEFVCLQGVTHERVMQELQDADLTIGKMKMGYYANAQIESLAAGVPAVTWVRDEFMTDDLRRSGLIFSTLDDLEATLERLITHPEELEAKRRIARDSVRRLHPNDAIAEDMKQLYATLTR